MPKEPIADAQASCNPIEMNGSPATSKNDKLYDKALEVHYSHRVGLWMPIMWHLALRGHTGAMIELADWFAADNSAVSFGTPASAFRPAGLYRRAYRKRDARAAHNAAMSLFNQNDLAGYRQWLGRAAKAGDADAGKQLRRFESRLWHGDARRIRRHRPYSKRIDW